MSWVFLSPHLHFQPGYLSIFFVYLLSSRFISWSPCLKSVRHSLHLLPSNMLGSCLFFHDSPLAREKKMQTVFTSPNQPNHPSKGCVSLLAVVYIGKAMPCASFLVHHLSIGNPCPVRIHGNCTSSAPSCLMLLLNGFWSSSVFSVSRLLQFFPTHQLGRTVYQDSP